MSITNLGNQYITFDYRHPATGRDFNTVLRGAIQPGIYEGGEITITGANTVSIAPFIAYLYSSTDKLVRAETRTAVSLTIAESTPVLSITFSWADVAENWLDWNQRAHGSSAITNEVCLGEMVFVASAINSIDYTVKNWGKQLESDVLTGQAPLTVASTTKVTNLNVDMLDDAHKSIDGTFASNSDLLIPTEKAVNTYLQSVIDALIPPGTSMDYAGTTPPAKWMTEDGSSLLRSSYPVCWANLHSVIGTCTISIEHPGVVSYTLHPFITGDCVHFTTTGALPTNLSPSTGYYVIYVDGNTFRLATTYANALAGTAINTGGTQSGVHTLVWSPWNIADSTHFYIPDTRGLLVEGHGVQGYTPWASVRYAGRLGQYKQDQMQGHWHNYHYRRTGFDTGGAYGDGVAYAVADGPLLDRVKNPINDGTHDDPRTGFITSGPRVGKNRIIRVL